MAREDKLGPATEHTWSEQVGHKSARSGRAPGTDGEHHHMAGCRLSTRDRDKENCGTTGSGSTRTHEAYHTKKTGHTIKHPERHSHGSPTWIGQPTCRSLHEAMEAERTNNVIERRFAQESLRRALLYRAAWQRRARLTHTHEGSSRGHANPRRACEVADVVLGANGTRKCNHWNEATEGGSSKHNIGASTSGTRRTRGQTEMPEESKTSKRCEWQTLKENDSDQPQEGRSAIAHAQPQRKIIKKGTTWTLHAKCCLGEDQRDQSDLDSDLPE
ncbi:hypothetical protein R1flu_026363 [Riccia fluitans]|uniref:Uncharacterized protein n=1 Tax=Riccia fluitans TaxID=41844 RepID=A0ABD1XFQ8_9MARC